MEQESGIGDEGSVIRDQGLNLQSHVTNHYSLPTTHQPSAQLVIIRTIIGVCACS